MVAERLKGGASLVTGTGKKKKRRHGVEKKFPGVFQGNIIELETAERQKKETDFW